MTTSPPAPRPQPPTDLPAIEERLLPLPAVVEPAPAAAFLITDRTRVVVPAGPAAVRIGEHAAELVRASTGLAVPVATGEPGLDTISVELIPELGSGGEGYELEVTADGVRVRAGEPAGGFRAVQTLAQLLPPSGPPWLPGGRIVDQPRFAWRGAMLDVARHFFGVDEVKHYVDLIARYKINVLHLHLTDDQGWRFEVRAWPRLTEIGGAGEVGGGAGGYYTQDDYAEIVAYAAARFITVVPEIDMPGHTNAALASYAELNCDDRARRPYTGTSVGFSALCVDKDVTYHFVDDVIGELAALTPGPYIHIGGDEVQTLAGADYARFVERAREIVESHGKQLIGWQEVAEAQLAASSLVQQWNPHAGTEQAKRAIAQGAKLVLSPADRIYLDMMYDARSRFGTDWAGYVEVDASYEWDPVRLIDGATETDVLGIEAPLWTETVTNMDQVEFMAFPRLAAAAEVGWTAAERRDWDDFRSRLAAQAPLWTQLGISYYPSPQIDWLQ